MGVRMRTKGVETETVSGTCVCQNLSMLRITGATEERAAAEWRLGCSPLPRARGPCSLLLVKEGGAAGWTRLLAAPRSGPRVLWVRPRPFPLLTLWCPAPRASPGAWEALSPLPSPVPLPAALSAYYCSQPGPWAVWVPHVPSRFPCPHPPRPCRLPLAPAEVTVLRPRLSRRGAAAGAPSSLKHLPLLTFITWSSCSLLPLSCHPRGPPSMPISPPVPPGWARSPSASLDTLTFDNLRWVWLWVNCVSQRGASRPQPGGFNVTLSGHGALRMS